MVLRDQAQFELAMQLRTPAVKVASDMTFVYVRDPDFRDVMLIEQAGQSAYDVTVRP